MFLMSLLLTIQDCDLLNLPPFPDWHELAGWLLAGWLGVRPASLCHVYFQSPARLVSQSDKRQTSCPQWRCMHRCVFSLRAAREGNWENAARTDICGSSSSPHCATPPPPPPATYREACSWHSVITWGVFAANCMSLGQLAIQWEGVARGRLESRGKPSYLHSPSAPPRRHTVSEVSDEMKSPIIEKNKMGQEEEPELLVKGELNSSNILVND